MKKIFISLLMAFFTGVCFQFGSVVIVNAADMGGSLKLGEDEGPTLEQTMEFLKSKLDGITQIYKTPYMSYTYIHYFNFKDCNVIRSAKNVDNKRPSNSEYEVNLKDMNNSWEIRTDKDFPENWWTASETINERPLVKETNIFDGSVEYTSKTSFPTRSRDTAEQVGRAFEHATKLCKKRPVKKGNELF